MYRLRWRPFSSAWLLLLLQRTPVLRVATQATAPVAPSRVVARLQTAFASTGGLGVVIRCPEQPN